MEKVFPAWTYPGVVKNVVDGDTVDIRLDKGHGEYSFKRYRIYQEDGAYFDTPELKGRGVNEAHKKHGQEAKARAIELLLDKNVYVTTHKKGPFRYLAQIWIPDGNGGYNDFSEVMIVEGFQKKENY